ncbi:MAG: bacteriohemerythrin [Rhodoferax sp.]|nr:MAG: bacteriohemerythrin [Rhodoferax sp.]
MALFIWTNTLATGNAFIDADHHELVTRVNTVLECIAQRADNLALSQALDKLGSFTREHFAQEEAIMNKVGYARAQEHGAQHHALLEQMDQVIAQLRAGEAIDQMALYNSLTRWVVDHIQQYDREFAQTEVAQAQMA